MIISGCIIAKNEEKDIKMCVESLLKTCDEVVFVDTGSTDSTIEIVEEMGIKVHHFKWNNDFSAARNFAVEKAKGQWILFLDADEYILNKNKDKFKEMIKLAKDYDGILLEIKNIGENEEIQSSFKNVRLFRKKDIRYKNKIHENPIRLDGKQMKVLDIANSISIIHTGYTKEKNLIKKRYERNLKLLFEELEIKPNDSLIYWYIAETYQLNEDLLKQIEYSKKSILAGTFKNIKQSILPYISLINAYLDLYSKGFFVDTSIINYEIQKAILEYPDEAIFSMFNGVFEMLQYRYTKALVNMDIASKKLENETISEIDYSTQFLHIIHNNKGIVYQLKKETDKAFQEYTKSLKIKSHQENILKNILFILKNEKSEDIIEFLYNFYDLNKKEDLNFLIKCSLEAGNKVLLSYYLTKWDKNNFGSNISIIWSLILNKKYDLAFEKSNLMFSESDNEDILFIMLLIVVCTNNKDYFDVISPKINLTYKRIIEGFNNEEVCLQEEEKVLLINLLDKLIIIDRLDKVDYLIERYSDIAHKCYSDIGRCFYDNRIYDRAIEFYKKSLDKSILSEKSIDYKFIGLSYYYLDKYEDACTNLLLAIDLGCLDNEIYEYLDFSKDKVNKDLCQKVELILNIVKNQVNLNSIKNVEKLKTVENYNVISKKSENSRNLLVNEDIKKLNKSKLNLGCGRNILEGWINLDIVPLDGVDVVADLDNCRNNKLPFEDNSMDEIVANHVIEHINNPLDLMEELHRISKPNAKAIFRCPYGSSDDAYEDPTHVKQYYINSFSYFSQPTYWRADYGYRGDWEVLRVILIVNKNVGVNRTANEILNEINKQRNIVNEMIVELRAIKPIRNQDKNMAITPKIEIELR